MKNFFRTSIVITRIDLVLLRPGYYGTVGSGWLGSFSDHFLAAEIEKSCTETDSDFNGSSCWNDRPGRVRIIKMNNFAFKQMTQLIASTSGKLHDLVMSFALNNTNGAEFLKEFKTALKELDNQVTVLAQPINPNTTADSSSMSKFM
ncbi:unnamed protein product [Adineta ricciae]|uniref:Uncharacterized protein n=1 Tax=Adineta ricciae TaxID=249248 RepID=A0A813VKA2_ADIRI|nr:unnamed protein product [Adineta ricciae]